MGFPLWSHRSTLVSQKHVFCLCVKSEKPPKNCLCGFLSVFRFPFGFLWPISYEEPRSRGQGSKLEPYAYVRLNPKAGKPDQPEGLRFFWQRFGEGSWAFARRGSSLSALEAGLGGAPVPSCRTCVKASSRVRRKMVQPW